MPIDPETPRRKLVAASHVPMLRYGFYAGLALAVLCLLFTATYISLYSYRTTETFEQHHDGYLAAANGDNLKAVLLARTAQNKALLQSCGIVAGISFGFLGFSLFLLGIEGSTDVGGKFEHYSVEMKKVAPGSLILIAAIALVAISALHRIELDFGAGDSQDPLAAGAKKVTQSTTERMQGGDNSKP